MTEDPTRTMPRSPRWRRWLRRAAVLACLPPLLLFVLLAVSIAALAPLEEAVSFDTAAAQGISFTLPSRVVPGPGLPADLEIQSSNNVVDLTCYRGEYFLAFRTGPTHYASAKARIVVLRSADQARWELETALDLSGADLREPRFLEYRGKLILYFIKAGNKFYWFEPEGIFATERLQEGRWSEPVSIFKPGYIVWRARVHDGVAYMSVYHGEGLYNLFNPAGEVRLLTSADGYDWKPISDAPQVVDAGAEEADFEFDAAGNLVAVVRLEMEGGMVCRASKDRLDQWDCEFTPYKYDSPFLLRRGNAFYVVARRNVSGAYHRGWDALPDPLERGCYLLRYAFTRKRTSLFRLDPDSMSLAPLLDFPSCGDTAYAALSPLGESAYYMVYYSTDIGGRDWPWTLGQVIGCNIYETVLRFPGTAGKLQQE
ncbi:MAG: hypothetical protein KA184_09625 [Candidatus Hydrogenedentes bacterium]|nr:hypothetical protein [Candidatus Hydrogenedentota bacterium]